jgi:hypothetical protein
MGAGDRGDAVTALPALLAHAGHHTADTGNGIADSAVRLAVVDAQQPPLPG